MECDNCAHEHATASMATKRSFELRIKNEELITRLNKVESQLESSKRAKESMHRIQLKLTNDLKNEQAKRSDLEKELKLAQLDLKAQQKGFEAQLDAKGKDCEAIKLINLRYLEEIKAQAHNLRVVTEESKVLAQKLCVVNDEKANMLIHLQCYEEANERLIKEKKG